MIALSDPMQCDDHCRLVFSGRVWWIMRKSGDFLLVTNDEGKFILDLSAVDWDAYLAEATRLTRENFTDPRDARAAKAEEDRRHG